MSSILERFQGRPRRATRRPPPLDMLIATILSQNTSDTNSHRAYTSLRTRFPRWNQVLRARRSAIASAIRAGGIANEKSGRIKDILTLLMKEHGTMNLAFLQTMTDDEAIEALTSFKGVGTKTAACVLLFSLCRDVFPVDTHIHRICARLGLAHGCPTPDHTFRAMRGLVPGGMSHSLHTNLIRFGRTVCLARDPRCGQCPLYHLCGFIGKAENRRRSRIRSKKERDDFIFLDAI